MRSLKKIKGSGLRTLVSILTCTKSGADYIMPLNEKHCVCVNVCVCACESRHALRNIMQSRVT